MISLALKRPSTTDVPPSVNNAGFTIEPIPSKPSAYRLEMYGFLSPGWSGRLAAALAQHRIEIVRGQAEKVSASSWRSSFELKAAPFATKPLGLDYMKLANTEPQTGRDVPRISLQSFTTEPISRHEGSLYVEIKAVDRLGFLGDLLDYFSMRCLFPVKMAIDTQDGTAIDRFWLRGVGGSVPSDTIMASIRENLEQLVGASR